MSLTFSNPRVLAEFADWPNGRNRVKCRFYVEHDLKRGFRVCRQTTDKNGQWCKPKMHTYASLSCIVDGSDGKTYILRSVPEYGMICVDRHDFMSESSVTLRDAEYQTLLELIKAAK